MSLPHEDCAYFDAWGRYFKDDDDVEMALYTWRSMIGFGSLTFGRHAFGRTMNSVVDRDVVRIVAETYIKSSAIAKAFPHVPSRISRSVFASLISASGITFTVYIGNYQ
ncbi:hypothetical protein L6452_36150 [Arctium lappa]|uniref:Uncharacterized protein n=1 Tax=Arctium lappa TaxID=4217 RepID=A0ACB8Y7N8_ARCLA|nr:hypothetical protein L6452_36150 [Arctium lappa]